MHDDEKNGSLRDPVIAACMLGRGAFLCQKGSQDGNPVRGSFEVRRVIRIQAVCPV